MQVRRQLIIEPIAVLEEELPRPLDWAELFGNANPVEMEIGCGKGTFITQQAVARPDVNFFGIEWAKFFWRFTCDRLRRNGCAAGKNGMSLRAATASRCKGWAGSSRILKSTSPATVDWLRAP